MESEMLKYKKLEKIVGLYKNKALKAEMEIQNNHIKMRLLDVRPTSLNEVLEKYNYTDWGEKQSTILNHNKKDDLEIDNMLLEESTREKVLEYISNVLLNRDNIDKWLQETEIRKDIDKYKGPSVKLIEWIYTFSNRILDKSIMEFIPNMVASIEEIELPEFKYDKINLDEYIVYMGPNEKYRGCIGEIVSTRNNSDANLLVSFPGKNKQENTSGKLWCNGENLLAII